MKIDLTIFAKRLKEARQKAGLTQAELAKKAEVTPATISSYETAPGNASNSKKASLDIAMSLAKSLNVSLDWLCGMDEQADKSNNITDFTAKDYLYSLVRVITEMSCDLEETIASGDRALNIVITKHPLINFINKINDLLKVYRAGTLTTDLYETCVDKIVDDYSSYYMAFDNFATDDIISDAEGELSMRYEELNGYPVVGTFSVFTNYGSFTGFISEKYIEEYKKACEENEKKQGNSASNNDNSD